MANRGAMVIATIAKIQPKIFPGFTTCSSEASLLTTFLYRSRLNSVANAFNAELNEFRIAPIITAADQTASATRERERASAAQSPSSGTFPETKTCSPAGRATAVVTRKVTRRDLAR